MRVVCVLMVKHDSQDIPVVIINTHLEKDKVFPVNCQTASASASAYIYHVLSTDDVDVQHVLEASTVDYDDDDEDSVRRYTLAALSKTAKISQCRFELFSHYMNH